MAAISLRDYQQAGVDGIRAAFRRNESPVLFVLPTGGGKCLGAGTPVLMFDGSIKAVEDVLVGDLLMGPDSKPRTVLSLARGSEELYRVTPVKGDAYVVNESHILSLRNTRTLDLRNIGIREYLQEPNHWRARQSGWRLPGILRGDLSIELSEIMVSPIGHGDYFGFEIDGDRLFMLGDFTVTHNTYTFSYIASSAADLGNPVIIIVHRKELLLQASQALTNLGIAHGMISPHFTADPRQRVQVASVDTLLIRLKKQKFKFSLCIFDEAHHVLASNKWGRAWEQLGFPAMLGVTATPVRGDGKGLGAHCGGVFKDMVLGPSVVELIGRGMLLNPIVYTSLETPDLEGLKTNSEGDYNLADLAQRVDKPRITGSAVKQYTKICPGARAIVFCASIAHARHVVEQFNAAGYRFALLVGQPEMSDTERDDVNKRLRRGELDGACTVDLVSEGYDLPDLTCCIMLRPTASEALFLQQIGRVMRPSDGKEFCWLLDHVGNVGSIQDGEFKRKHGMPNEEREWSLDGRKKGKGKKKVEKVIDVAQCPKCYLAHMPAPTCPACGHIYEVKTRQLEEVDGELHKMTQEMADSINKAKQVEVRNAYALEELERIEAERGYKKGWAKHTFEAKKRKKVRRVVDRPPEPSLEEMKVMTLERLERVAREQGWPRDFGSSFYHTQGAGADLFNNDQQALGGQ